MKRVKQNIYLLLLVGLLAVLSGCTNNQKAAGEEAQEEKFEVRYQGQAGVVMFPELAADLGYFGTIALKYVGNSTGGPQDIQLVATNQIDFGNAFNGAIIKSVKEGVKIKSVVASYGSDQDTFYGYYTLNESGIKTAKDLIGKNIGVNILGAHHEFVIKEYLRRSGLTEKEIQEVTLVVIPPANVEQALRNKQIDVATLGGIFRDKALERGDIEPLFTDAGLFGPFTAGTHFFSEKFIEENSDIVKEFVEGTAKAIEWARETPKEEVIARMDSIIEKRNRNEATELTQYWKSTGISEVGGLIDETEFQVWIDWLIENGDLKESEVTHEDLYTNEYNQHAIK